MNYRNGYNGYDPSIPRYTFFEACYLDCLNYCGNGNSEQAAEVKQHANARYIRKQNDARLEREHRDGQFIDGVLYDARGFVVIEHSSYAKYGMNRRLTDAERRSAEERIRNLRESLRESGHGSTYVPTSQMRRPEAVLKK